LVRSSLFEKNLVTEKESYYDINLPGVNGESTFPLIAKYAILKGLNNNNLVGLTLQNAVFDYAVLDGLSLNSSDDTTAATRLRADRL
jgi:hypothetical protein